jgi:hypothetical protein
LVQAEAKVVKRKSPESSVSYDHSLRGRTLLLQHTPETTNETLAQFPKAIDLDPSHHRMGFCKPSLKVRFRLPAGLKGLILKPCDGAPHNRGSNPAGKRSGQAAMQPDLLSGFIVAAKKRSRSKGARAKRAVPAVWHFSIVLSTAARSLVNMTVTAVTSGSVLLCLFAVKRFL